jgi:hypothetical protein
MQFSRLIALIFVCAVSGLELWSILPTVAYPRGDIVRITVRGVGFNALSPAAVSIGMTSCGSVTRLNDASMTCTLAMGVGRLHNVTVYNSGSLLAFNNTVRFSYRGSSLGSLSNIVEIPLSTSLSRQ